MQSVEDVTGEPLRPENVLASSDLYARDETRASGPAGLIREGRVHSGRPLFYPVEVDELPVPLRSRARTAGHRYYGALFAFDLDELAEGHRYTSARFEVTFEDRAMLALRIDADGDALGLVQGFDAPLAASAAAARAVAASRSRPGWLRRLAARTGQPRAWTYGRQSHRFGWVYTDPAGDLLIPRQYAMHALIESAAAATELDGTLSVQVEITRSLWGTRIAHQASMREAVPFREPLPTDPGEATAAVRLCMAADVQGYSKQTNPLARQTQQRLVDVLAGARAHAGIDEHAVEPQLQGDGQFTVLPVGIDESMVIPRLVRGLWLGLTETNRGLNASARVRLRVALHRGLVQSASNGWVGNAAIAVHRILDSEPVRAALDEHPGADFVLGVPDVLFRDVIAHSYESLRPEEFRQITVSLPAKGFRECSWLYVAEPA